MTNPTSQAIAQRNEQQSASGAALISQYSTEFTSMLPSHVNGESWIRSAKAALKKSRIVGGRHELETAALNNPGAFFNALREAASLGLRPGTDEYYLTARKGKGGSLEILGIVGYQGEIELIYRAGAVSSVIVEVVRANDSYVYRRGIEEIPVHEFPAFAREADRGELVGVYAYARMKDGAYSKVVELNVDDIERIKKTSESAKADAKNNTNYSPWNTHPVSMWLKSAVHQLQKWVPTSAEYREALIRDAVAVQSARASAENGADAVPPGVDPETGVIDAELVEDQPPAATEKPPTN